VVRDTAADPQRASAAVDELARLGVAALAGEYHSVVARAAAARADALGLPFPLPAGESTRTSSSTLATVESP
jgi:ABC-type branched-subunit amino acid transport system substrate-binding protein